MTGKEGKKDAYRSGLPGDKDGRLPGERDNVLETLACMQA
jgi:hypothetical protein